jgi:hypothetical protein
LRLSLGGEELPLLAQAAQPVRTAVDELQPGTCD